MARLIVQPDGARVLIDDRGVCLMTDDLSDTGCLDRVRDEIRPGDRVLFVGLGLGLVVDMAVERGAERVIVIERDGSVIETIAPFIFGPVEIVHADAMDYDLSDRGPFDLIYADPFTQPPSAAEQDPWIDRLAPLGAPGGLLGVYLDRWVQLP